MIMGRRPRRRRAFGGVKAVGDDVRRAASLLRRVGGLVGQAMGLLTEVDDILGGTEATAATRMIHLSHGLLSKAQSRVRQAGAAIRSGR